MDIAVLGAGSWGTALASLLARNGHRVVVWSHNSAVADEIQKTHHNATYLPDIDLPTSLHASTDLHATIRHAQMIFIVVPAQAVREVMTQIATEISPNTILVCCAKGIEVATGLLMSQVLTDILPQHPESHRTFLSGPSFALEVARDLPTTVVVAGQKIAADVQAVLRRRTFLPYTHDDVAGVEVGGAVKNVLAIACGICDGLGFGANTQAAIITRGLYEMTKIGLVYGARPLTFSGLAGIGDLVLTCTGALSRNRQVGMQLARGAELSSILAGMTMVAEGVKTAEALYRVIDRHQIKAPILGEVYHILYEAKSPSQAVEDILRLEIGAEQGALQ